ncbi:hypothetical protein BDN70DRAFT_908071 [Pholiota conissans]|uniref:Uncharacterized protein n=1 Tax=Pholiota conissans TaxID=109636 RepID=A0A9P6CWU6_9AGAR|nr:hypothetical protein BDN70DRAFT_908071 [Pholiota conissans]
MTFTLEETKLISIFIESTLYGLYIFAFALTCWVLVKKQYNAHPINTSMLFLSLFMFLLATMHIITSSVRIMKAFITLNDEPGGPGAFFIRLSEPTKILETSIYMTQILVGDFLVIWRAYKVWGNSLWITVLPLILTIGSAVVDIRILYFFAKTPYIPAPNHILNRWFYFFPTITLITNLLCTGLIAYRIWHINSRMGSLVGNSLRPVLLLVIESGAIYSATLITLLIVYGTQLLITNILLDAGLVFSMVMIRIGLGLSSSNGESEDMGPISTLRIFSPTEIRESTILSEHDCRNDSS